ncbi:hypothetical protein RVBP16_3970 [Pseudomonas phage sp. 30-2]|nr:hypothetical protein RVBP16_3970 [Pseudomonas phage sp. 30-2]
MAKVLHVNSIGNIAEVFTSVDLDSALLHAIKRCAMMGKVKVVGPNAPVFASHYDALRAYDVQWRLVPPGCGVTLYVIAEDSN